MGQIIQKHFKIFPEDSTNMTFILYGSSVLALFGISYGVLRLTFSTPFRSYIALAICLFCLFFVSYLLVKEKNKGLKFEVLLFSLMILSLFSFGFISQTYHIKYETLLFWFLTVFAPAFMSRYNIIFHIWICALVVSLSLIFKFLSLGFIWPWLFLLCFFILKNKKIQTAYPFLSTRVKAFGLWTILICAVFFILFKHNTAINKFIHYISTDFFQGFLLYLKIFLLWPALFIAVAFSEYKRFLKGLIFLIIFLGVLVYDLSSFFYIPLFYDFLSLCIIALTIFLFSLLKNKTLLFLCIAFFISEFFSSIFRLALLFNWAGAFICGGIMAFIPVGFVLWRENILKNLNKAIIFTERITQPFKTTFMGQTKKMKKQVKKDLQTKGVFHFLSGFRKIRFFKSLSNFLFIPVCYVILLVGCNEYKLRTGSRVILPVNLSSVQFDVLSGYYLEYEVKPVNSQNVITSYEYEDYCWIFQKKKSCDLDTIFKENGLYRYKRYYLLTKQAKKYRKSELYNKEAMIVLSVRDKDSFLAKDILIEGKFLK